MKFRSWFFNTFTIKVSDLTENECLGKKDMVCRDKPRHIITFNYMNYLIWLLNKNAEYSVRDNLPLMPLHQDPLLHVLDMECGTYPSVKASNTWIMCEYANRPISASDCMLLTQ